MRRILISILIVIFLLSCASAEIIIEKQPEAVYNLGDSITIPVIIKATSDISGTFKMNLFCEGRQENFYQNDVALLTGEEKRFEASVILTKERIEEIKGNCKIKGTFRDDYVLTKEFKISDLIEITLKEYKLEFKPGEFLIIKGDAIKENGEGVEGFINLEIIKENTSESLTQLSTINKGFFSMNVSLPKETKAGAYLVKLDAYEKDIQEQITNKGFTNYNILVTQVPTSLEIVFENAEVEPGTSLKVKIILHDQTGESIDTTGIITIKNNKNEILEQIEKPTDEFLEFPVAYNEPAAEWKVTAVSNKLTSEAIFSITEKEDVEILLINRTIKIINKGNVPYCNKSVLVKIGNESLNIDTFNTCLEVGKEKEYLLSAPEGEYEVKIISEEEEMISKNVVLTGKAVDVKEISKKGFRKYLVVWIFIIVILGFVAFLAFKKNYRKNFFAYISKKKDKDKDKDKEHTIPLGKDSLVETKNKAELSLSIKGNKQNASLVCLKIKNLRELETHKGNIRETLQKIVDFAEEKKSAIYQNQDNLFLILAPVKTKTFSNEKNTLELAQKTEKILKEHNRLFKQKIEFGISVNYGTLIAKQEKEILKFMSMGTLITTAKRIASISKGEILLGEKLRERLGSNVKVEKQIHGNTTVYLIKEIKNRDEHKNFLSNFVKRLEKD